jgi:hypothetical protein
MSRRRDKASPSMKRYVYIWADGIAVHRIMLSTRGKLA